MKLWPFMPKYFIFCKLKLVWFQRGFWILTKKTKLLSVKLKKPKLTFEVISPLMIISTCWYLFQSFNELSFNITLNLCLTVSKSIFDCMLCLWFKLKSLYLFLILLETWIFFNIFYQIRFKCCLLFLDNFWNLPFGFDIT